MERLTGKVALVTGAGHGIGEGIARLFAAEGASVVLADKNAGAVAAVARNIQDKGGVALAVTADVSDTKDIRRMVEAALAQFDGLNILVNNAALTSFGRSLDAEDMEARFDRLMATNVKSVWMALRFALPYLRVRGGSVINISSVHALASGAGNSAYAASKGALVAGTRALALELAPDNIRVNCISPGRIWTDGRDETDMDFRTRIQPLPIEGKPDDIAHCAVYLASDESRFCTGANFVIDGGATALLAGPPPPQFWGARLRRHILLWFPQNWRLGGL